MILFQIGVLMYMVGMIMWAGALTMRIDKLEKKFRDYFSPKEDL